MSNLMAPGQVRRDSALDLPSLPIDCTSFHRPIIVLDLDETLVHVRRSGDLPFAGESFAIDTGIRNRNGGAAVVWTVNERPHLRDFLDKLSKHCTIVVFTAGSASYADAVVRHLDPQGDKIFDYFSLDDCTRAGRYGRVMGTSKVKDLRLVCNDMRRVLLVDNTSDCFFPQAANGILVKEFKYDHQDQELLRLLAVLVDCCDFEDMRLAVFKWNA